MKIKIRSLPIAAISLGAITLISCTPEASAPAEESQVEPLYQSGFEPTDDFPIEATSLLGEALLRPTMTADASAKQADLLAAARTLLEAEPSNIDQQIWVGRRLAYLGRYQEAISHFSAAITQQPEEARLYRHRGHRYLTVRRLDQAEQDLKQAAQLTAQQPDQVEPDGLPNAAGIPTSTLKTNIYYHLGLAHYLQGEWDQAVDAYQKCLDLSESEDMAIATKYWLYLTLRRASRNAEAQELAANIPAQLDLLESGDYHRLLMLFRGDLAESDLLGDSSDPDSVSSATVKYGVGVNRLLSGNQNTALDLFRDTISAKGWAAFGFLAAEAEVARMEVEPAGSRID